MFAAADRLRTLYRDCVKPPVPPSRRCAVEHILNLFSVLISIFHPSVQARRQAQADGVGPQ